MKHISVGFIIGLFFLQSCVAEKASYLSLTGLRSLDFSKDGGSEVIAFTCNQDWSISSSESWAKVSPSSGAATDGDVKVTVTVDPNTAFDARSADLIIKVEDLTETVSVKQVAGIALIVSTKSFELTNAAQTIEVTVQQNVDYTVEIDSASKGWIEKADAKGLATDKVLFNIAANTEYDEREGSITFKQTGGDLSVTVTVHQSEAYGLFVTTPEYELSNSAHSLYIEVRANVEYEVVSQAAWISYVETKALTSSTITLNIAANDSYDSRTGTVLVRQKDGNLSGIITIIQSQKDGLFVTPTSFNLTRRAQTIEIKAKNNVPFSVIIPDGAENWVSVQSNNQTKALVDDVVVLAIAQNNNVESRSSSITIKQDDGPLAETITINQGPDVRPETGYVVAGYATYWDTTMPDPTYLTHINYAFATINSDFETLYIREKNRLADIVGLKSKNPKLKVLLSIGGWGAGNFSEMAASEAHRKKFCSNCLAAIGQYSLDGIDIDWEYPTSTMAGITASADDTKNFTLLLKDLRETLGVERLITMASAASAKYIDWPSAIPYLDWVNIMTYDMGKPPYHNAALFPSSMTPSGNSHSCSGSVKLHMDNGVSGDMLVMGIPFFGRESSGDEIYYNEIKNYTGERRWDDVAKVPYLVNSSGAMVLSYDDETSVGLKAEYVKENGFLGAMYWNIEADDADWTLSKAIAAPLMGWVNPNPDPDPEAFLAPNQYVQKFLEEVNYPETNNPDTDKEYSYSLINGYPGGGPSVNNEEIPPTYTISWTAGSGKQKLKVWDSDWSRECSLSGGVGKQDITNLVPNTTYYWTVSSSGGSTIASGSFKTRGLLHQVFFTPDVRNARDLGGYKGFGGKTVVYRKLYRGGSISSSYLNSSGKKEMLAEGIKAELDLREAEDVPSKSPLGSDIAFYAPGFDSGYNHMVRDNPDKVGKTFKWVVDRLRENKPVYFHCAAGRDRTGTMAVLLLGALGVGESDMAKDYELTYFSPFDWSMYQNSYQHTRDNYTYKSVRKTIFSKTSSGTYQERIVQFLLNNGVTQQDIDDYQAIMLK